MNKDNRAERFLEVYDNAGAWDKTILDARLIWLFVKSEPRDIRFALQLAYYGILARLAPLILALILAVLILAVVLTG